MKALRSLSRTHTHAYTRTQKQSRNVFWGSFVCRWWRTFFIVFTSGSRESLMGKICDLRRRMIFSTLLSLNFSLSHTSLQYALFFVLVCVHLIFFFESSPPYPLSRTKISFLILSAFSWKRKRFVSRLGELLQRSVGETIFFYSFTFNFGGKFFPVYFFSDWFLLVFHAFLLSFFITLITSIWLCRYDTHVHD